VIIVDRADILLRERPDDMFDLIESFLIQFHHWYDQKNHVIFVCKWRRITPCVDYSLLTPAGRIEPKA